MNDNEGTESPSGDGSQVGRGGSDADGETDGPGDVVDRVAEFDEELAAEVRRTLDEAATGGFEWDSFEATDGEAPAADAEADVPDGDEGAGEDDGEADDLAAELAAREERIEELEAELEEREEEIDDLESRLKRKQADFQNYKKRAEKKRERIQERATEDLVERLLGVRDDLKRGIENDHPDVESLRDGVEMVLRNFDRVLEEEDVVEVDPDPGTEVDPERHEVMMRVDSQQPDGTVAEVYTPGYEMGEKVIRAAKVTVSTGPAESDGEDADEAED